MVQVRNLLGKIATSFIRFECPQDFGRQIRVGDEPLVLEIRLDPKQFV
jgi:hypothetical protein